MKKFANSAVQSNKICGKVRKSQRQNFATKVRKSIKSFKMYHLKEKCKKIWNQERSNMSIRYFGLFCKTCNTSWPLFVTHCRIVSFQGLRLKVFTFSDNPSAENSKLSAESGRQRLQLLECIKRFINYAKLWILGKTSTIWLKTLLKGYELPKRFIRFT